MSFIIEDKLWFLEFASQFVFKKLAIKTCLPLNT
jgi:hypothetical protein